MPSWMKAVAAALAGLVPALLAELVAFGMAGAGHGWVAPALYGLALFVAYPALFVLLALRHRPRLFLAVLIAAGLAADAALILHTLAEERVYFEHAFAAAPVGALGWTLLWLGWQAAAAALLVHRRDGD